MCLSHNPFFQVTSLIFIIKSWCWTEPKAGDVFFLPSAHQARVSLALRHFFKDFFQQAILYCASQHFRICRRRDQARPPKSVHRKRCAGQNFPGEHPPSQTHRLSSLVAGNGWSPECRGESVSHRPMVRSSHTCLWERLAVSPGLITTRSLGSWKLPGSG